MTRNAMAGTFPERTLWVLAAIVGVALAASAVHPYDRLTWLMEVAPVLVVVPVLAYTRRRFPLTRLLYGLIALHCLVLILGGAYTYARVPVGFWIQELLALDRNPYDKIGHFMQGLVPALAAREILLGLRFVTSRAMAGFLSVCVALAVSAVYEMVEWWAALIMGQGAEEFLGTQGDVWDTQSDMFLAGIGACVAVLVLARRHDRQLAEMGRG